MNKKGFTLIELLIVIAIIGILTGLAAVSYSGVQARGRDAQRKNDLNQIKVTLSTYYNAQVPTAFVPSSANCTNTNGSCSTMAVDGSSDLLSVALQPNYIRQMPTDPKNTGVYLYKYTSSSNNNIANQNFTLTASLENTNDKRGWGGGNAWIQDGYSAINN